MSWEGHLLRKPVGWGDISTATGVGGPPYDLGNMIANGTLINKWALHKPVRLANGSDTPADISEYNTWVAKMKTDVVTSDGNNSAPYGLTVGTSINLYDVIGTNSAPAVDWVYQRPPASGTFWRRSLDFAGYTDSPNIPFNKLDAVFTFNRQANENVLVINTNQGEAGETSIPINEFSTLDNYQLMLAVKVYSYWWLTVMPTTIMRSIEEGQTVINFSLPSSNTIDLNTASGHDAYLVGITKNALNTGVWLPPQNDSFVRNMSSMIPLPFAEKTDCHFKFKVRESPDSQIIHYTYTIYLSHSYVLKKVEFKVFVYANLEPPTSITIQFSNLKIYPDYDYQHTTNYPLTNIYFVFGYNGVAFDYDQDTQMSTASQIQTMPSGLNYTLDSYPELTFDKSVNLSGYSWEDGGFDVKYIDD